MPNVEHQLRPKAIELAERAYRSSADGCNPLLCRTSAPVKLASKPEREESGKAGRTAGPGQGVIPQS